MPKNLKALLNAKLDAELAAMAELPKPKRVSLRKLAEIYGVTAPSLVSLKHRHGLNDDDMRDVYFLSGALSSSPMTNRSKLVRALEVPAFRHAAYRQIKMAQYPNRPALWPNI